MNISELQGKPKTELLTLAKEKGVTKAESLDQQDLILQMLKSEVEQVTCSARVSWRP